MTKRKRRHSGFELNPLAFAKKDITIDHIIGFIKRSWLMPVNAFSLENREEVLAMTLS